ncbi:hypothetical protein BDF22DRAFT_3044 [Syncephalis plumigaleata]|nr:hypothetical protein BDF22DRAFT_3044 [Syncephalis plumigaleata]
MAIAFLSANIEQNEEREEECQLSTPESVESNEDRGSNDGYDISQAPLASSQAELMCCVAALEKYCRPFVDFETAHNTMNMRMSKIENMLSELSNRMNDIEQRGKEETALKIVNPSPCTASFVSITGHSTPKEMVISGTDHLSLLKHRIAAHCANIGGLATTSGDDTQFEVKDCMDNQWSYQSPSNSSELDDDTSPLLKPDTLMAYQPCQECEESATMKASDTVEYPINDASISSDTLILDTLFDDTTTTAKHNGQQEQQCDSAMLRKPNRSLYYQLEVQDTDTVAKYFYQNNALHGFTSPKRVCHYPTKHDSLNSLIGLVPDTSMSDSNTSMDNEMISSILSDASDISHLTDHVWDEMITEGQGTKPNVTMPINISCSIAEAKDELIRLINDMDAKKALIDSAEMRLNAVKEGIHQNTEQILANEAMIECYQSRIASVLSNRNSTMDELADVNARLSNTAKLSSHDIDQLQHQQQMHQTKIECAVIEFDVMHKRLEEITCKTKDLEEEKESFCQSYEKGCEFIEELKKEYDELEDEYEHVRQH